MISTRDKITFREARWSAETMAILYSSYSKGEDFGIPPELGLVEFGERLLLESSYYTSIWWVFKGKELLAIGFIRSDRNIVEPHIVILAAASPRSILELHLAFLSMMSKDPEVQGCLLKAVKATRPLMESLVSRNLVTYYKEHSFTKSNKEKKEYWYIFVNPYFTI